MNPVEYEHIAVEQACKQFWNSAGIYRTDGLSDKPKYYVLDMFPYPSGAGLHVGHPLGYISSDIVARKRRMEGYHVLHPMGFDAFGLPAEQYAIQTGIHPAVSTRQNIDRYREQLVNIGLSFDWSREVITCQPEYYRWTQWIFLQLFHHYYDIAANRALPIAKLVERFEQGGSQGVHASCSEPLRFSAEDWKNMTSKERDELLMNYRLAFRRISHVNWCEALGTVLANDEIKDGVSERGGHPVEKKPMMQWALRITAYSERLLHDMESLDWSEALKTMQRNWIGKSRGCAIFFDLEVGGERIEVYSTRPDTIFGVSFLALAPEHPLAEQLCADGLMHSLQEYRKLANSPADRERKSPSGFFSGKYALHPFTNERVPVWIAEYVLIEYGTGAIMGVPGHDLRDEAFAKKFALPILKVIDFPGHAGADIEEKAGVMVNSRFLDGLEVSNAIDRAIAEIEVVGRGYGKTVYKMRDANFSRQRYWGEPIPVVYNDKGCAMPLDESKLPLELPHLTSLEPGRGGKSPLSRAEEWVQTSQGDRETDTMPGYAGSSWYFLRYMDPHNTNSFASKEALAYWRDVDLYIGGTEHAVGHLMYSRFWHKFLFDLGYVPTFEPFKKLVNQGMIQGVIESIYLLKQEGANANNLFISATIADRYPVEQLAKIPVHLDFVEDANSPAAHLSLEGIEKFLRWRPEFAGSHFLNEHEGGALGGLPPGFTIKTHSEIGKMSKRYHNVVNPDDVIREYGADCFRMYEMFLGPIEQSKPWDMHGIDGVAKFLKKYFAMFFDEGGHFHLVDAEPTREELQILHQCIKKVSQDIDCLSLNTCVSAFMICVNELRRLQCSKRGVLLPLTQLMAPFAPFITEHIWGLSDSKGSIHLSCYPRWDEALTERSEVHYPVSINGKKRYEWIVSKSLGEEELRTGVLELPEIKKWLSGVAPKKIILVPGRMINIVV